jgi:hypothetical protein
MAGSHSDTNVLQCSPVFDRLLKAIAHVVNYEINDNTYNTSYYLADDTYSDCATLVKIVCKPITEKTKRFI